MPPGSILRDREQSNSPLPTLDALLQRSGSPAVDNASKTSKSIDKAGILDRRPSLLGAEEKRSLVEDYVSKSVPSPPPARARRVEEHPVISAAPCPPSPYRPAGPSGCAVHTLHIPCFSAPSTPHCSAPFPRLLTKLGREQDALGVSKTPRALNKSMLDRGPSRGHGTPKKR